MPSNLVHFSTVQGSSIRVDCVPLLAKQTYLKSILDAHNIWVLKSLAFAEPYDKERRRVFCLPKSRAHIKRKPAPVPWRAPLRGLAFGICVYSPSSFS